MKAAIYIRVSTKLQETKFSLAAQRTELTAYAERQGWDIVGLFKDVESGGKLNKKGLNDLLDVVEEGKIDVVLCIDQDRLSRLDTVAWEYLKSTLRDNDVKIAEPGSMTDLANEDQEFISDIKNLIAKREKKAIVRRMMRGKKQRMREGKGWGKAPLGYYYDKQTKTYEVDEKWSWVIPFIDDLYLNKQYGTQLIADKLNEISRTPTGRMWNDTLIYRRLISKAFHGVMEKKFKSGEVISIENIYPPLRSKETYDRICEERKKRGIQFKVTSKQRDDINILRRTRFTCGLCGYRISLQQSGTSKNPYYYLKHTREKRVKDQSVCDIAINTVRVENNLIQGIKDLLAGENEARKYIDFDTDEHKLEDLENQIRILDKNINDSRSKIDKLIDLYIDGPFSKEQILEKQKQIESELHLHQQKRKEYQAKLDTLKKDQFNYDLIYSYLEIASNIETELTPLERTQLVGRLFPTATLYKDHIMMHMEIQQGFPVEVRIPIDDDPYTWHHTKANKKVR